MKKILTYVLLAMLAACNSSETKKCFCDVDGNLNLIPDNVRDERRERWHKKIAALYPNIPQENLPQGFQLSVEEIKSMAEFLNSKNPQPKSVIAYFGFDSDGAADSGRVTAVFVPKYEPGISFPPCRKGCRHLNDANVADSTQKEINLDLTQPCPPACGD